MAVTENLYTGNGSTTNYSFTFPYLATTDIKVSLNSVITTAYTFANATTVQFNTAPANGVAIRIYRDTDDSNLNATFYSGSAIRAQDLNDNFTQNLYVTQEAVNTADSATTTAASALSTANTALSNSTAAVSTANTAASDAATAVSTANTASANATTAVSTANAATTTANTALSNSTTAISTANTASSNATAAVNTANSAASDASTALSLVNNVIDYQIILDVASIPGSPVDGDRIEVVDSTGIESFTPLTGIPGGFTGAAGLSVRMSYDGTGSTWVWYDYSPTDPDSRYILDSTGTVTSTNILDGTIVDGDINASAAIAYSKLALTGTIVDADINASAEIAVSKLADGAARQLLQTDAAGTGVEWTDNVDIPGTLDVTGAATFDSSATVVGDLTVDTNTLYVDSTNNRVGIGTTSSNATLNVIGNAWFQDSASSGAIVNIRGLSDKALVDTNTYGAAMPLVFGVSTTERARIDSSGRLLVGTSTGTSTAKALVEGNTSDGLAGVFDIQYGGTSPVDGTNIGAIRFKDRTTDTFYAAILCNADAGTGAADKPGRLVFSTTADGASSPTERMRIASNGSTTLASGLAIGFPSMNNAGSTVTLSSNVIGPGAGTNTVKWNSTTGVLTYDTSTRLLKEDVVDCPYGIDEVKQLQPRKYFRTDDQKEEVGFIADEVVEILPEFVPTGLKSTITRNNDDTEVIPLAVNYDKLTAVLTKALQEVIAKIETLEAEVAALKAQ